MLSQADITAMVATFKDRLAEMSPAERQAIADQIGRDPGEGPMKEVGKLILKELGETYQIKPQ